MKVFSRNSLRTVGVCFEPSGVSLAIRRGRRGGSLVHRPLTCTGDGPFLARADGYRVALSALVAQAQVAGAHCVASLPMACCRVEWASLTGVRAHDLRTAVGSSAFWQARLGVTLESHRVWWRPVSGDGHKTDVLLAAAPHEDVDFYAETLRAAGLAVGAIGVSCFDYFDGEFSSDAARVTLVLDCADACVVAAGAFGLRAHAVDFDMRRAAALLSADARARDGAVDGLAACVRRCVEDGQAVARLHADLRVVAAQSLYGDWLESLKTRLSGFTVTWVDAWEAARLAGAEDAAGDGRWRLPRAAACLARSTRRTGGWMRGARVPAVNFDSRRDSRRFAPALFAAVCLLGLVSAYAHWQLLAEHRRLQPDAQRYVQLAELHQRGRAEVETLQNRMSHRVSFYSGIQHVSFERKLMPRLFALIEYAALEGVWLNSIRFNRAQSLQLTGKSLGDEQITRFIQRLRAAEEIADVFLESATVEARRDAAPVHKRRLKDFVIICRLQKSGENA